MSKIAILTTEFKRGLNWVFLNHQDDDGILVDSGKQTIQLLKAGIEYVVCTQPEHLIGMEISAFMIVGADVPQELIETAKTRTR